MRQNATDNQGLLLELVLQASLSNLNHSLTRVLTLLVVLLTLPYEVVLETVRSDVSNLTTQQILAVVCSDIANGKECIVV